MKNNQNIITLLTPVIIGVADKHKKEIEKIPSHGYDALCDVSGYWRDLYNKITESYIASDASRILDFLKLNSRTLLDLIQSYFILQDMADESDTLPLTIR